MIIFLLIFILIAYFVFKSMFSIWAAKKEEGSIFNRSSFPDEILKSSFANFLILKRYLTVSKTDNVLDYKASRDMRISYFLIIYFITFGSIFDNADFSKEIGATFNLSHDVVILIMFSIAAGLAGFFFQKSKKDRRMFNNFFKKSFNYKKVIFDFIRPTLDFGKWFALVQFFSFVAVCFLLKFFFLK